MGDKVYLGIDNGVTGTIGILSDHFQIVKQTPVKKVQDYTKKKKNISRIDRAGFTAIIDWVKSYYNTPPYTGARIHAVLERPYMTNQFSKINAIISAHRAFEATLIILETHEISYEVIDSKQWQKEHLPKGVTGSPQLKKCSMEKGIQLFPALKPKIEKHGDADGLLIAEWARRNNL